VDNLYKKIILGGNNMWIHHVCIQTEDYEKSLYFYTKILGFEIVSESRGFHKRSFNTWLKLKDFFIELQTPKEGDNLNLWTNLNAGPVHLGFLVENVDKEYERIINLGYNNFKLKNGEVIYEVKGEKLFKIKAPEGTEIEIRDTNIS
jgi:glyoxylase I family protein